MAAPIRRSAQLQLSFPYDWSNPAISDEAKTNMGEENSMTATPNHNNRWTEQEETELIARFRERLSAQDIADAHGRTTNTIVGRLVRLGLLMQYGRGYRRVEAEEWISFDEINAAKQKEGGDQPHNTGAVTPAAPRCG